MTALTTTAGLAPRPVPWRRLCWVAWRCYRAALVAAATVLVLAVLALLVRGLQMRTAYTAVQASTPQSGASCRFAFENVHNAYGDMGFAAGILMFVSAVVGAPLLARELETGTGCVNSIWPRRDGLKWPHLAVVACGRGRSRRGRAGLRGRAGGARRPVRPAGR